MSERNLEIEIKEVIDEGEYFKVKLNILIQGNNYEVTIPALVRKPAIVRHEFREDYLVIKLIDDSGEGIGSCCIHKDHLEKGCFECDNLPSRKI